MKIKEIIIEYLDTYAENSHTPKSIALYTGLKHSSVRKCLSRLFLDGKVAKPIGGLYQSKKITISSNNARYHELLIHKLHIISDELVTTKGVGGTFATPFIEDVPHRHPINHSRVITKEFENRKITFTYYKHKIDIFIGCTNNPLTYHDLKAFCSLLQWTHPNIPLSKYKICQVEFNIDIPIFGIDVPENATITLKMFENAWYRLYQHTKDKLRIETYYNSKIGLKEAISILYDIVEVIDNKYIKNGR